MARTSQRLVAAACAVSLVACTSFQPLSEQGRPDISLAQRQVQGVAVGDTLRIKLKTAAVFDLVVTAVNSNSIAGTQDGSDRQVLIAEVDSFERKQLDVARTALLIGSLLLFALGQYARGVSKLGNP